MSVEIREHTADLAIHARGDSLGEAVSEAARGLSLIATGRDDLHLQPDQEVRFELEAPDLPALVVAFLSELLWLLESQDTLWLGGGADIEESADGWRVLARGNGIRYEPDVHGQGTEIKAVTYHDLRMERDGAAWRCQVVVDI